MATSTTDQYTHSIHHERITAADVPRGTRRLLTAIEGLADGLGCVRLAVSERLSAAIQLDGRQQLGLDQVRDLAGRIAGHACPTCSPVARVQLAYLGRAAEADALRDEQVSTCRLLVGLAGRALRAIGRLIERATVGRSRGADDDVEGDPNDGRGEP